MAEIGVDPLDQLRRRVLELERRRAAGLQQQRAAAAPAGRVVDPHRLAAPCQHRADDRSPSRPAGWPRRSRAAAPPGRGWRPAAAPPAARPGRSALAACPGPPPPVATHLVTGITSWLSCAAVPIASMTPTPARRAARRRCWPGTTGRGATCRGARQPGEPPDPWHVLVSELMLQQTTVATVRGALRAVPGPLPDPGQPRRGAARRRAACLAGPGLLPPRARSLHACAQAVVARHGGRLPLDAMPLLELPGIGPYTAAAVAAIAGGAAGRCRSTPMSSGCSARMLALDAAAAGRHGRGCARAAAGSPAPARAGDFAQALMELGALVCTPRRPACLACPWRALVPCGAATGEPERYPRKAREAARIAAIRHGLPARAGGRGGAVPPAAAGRPARRA